MAQAPYTGGLLSTQWGGLSLAATAVNGLFGLFGGMGIARYQNQILDAQANIARVNAQTMELNAQASLRQGERAMLQKGLAAGQVKAAQRTAMAANGIDVGGSGTASELLASTDLTKEQDLLQLRDNAYAGASNARWQGLEQLNNANMLRASHTNSLMVIGNTLAATASQMGQTLNWMQMNDTRGVDASFNQGGAIQPENFNARNSLYLRSSQVGQPATVPGLGQSFVKSWL